ncbi:hypothetical protein T03_15145 [Trichinella britovi]|uniref:Uncharacterized protein n=1 Tax=Trichinella britovi TaxID=45882 RepID=A0A0V1C828_TRIBR|nr:hypothetical protein T03_15145 [Trichinella britovi]
MSGHGRWVDSPGRQITLRTSRPTPWPRYWLPCWRGEMRLSICRSCPSGPGRTGSAMVSFPAAQECPCQLAAEGISQPWPALAHGPVELAPDSCQPPGNYGPCAIGIADRKYMNGTRARTILS